MTPYWSDDTATIWHANALDLPLADSTVDLIVTSPPYFGLRSYQDGCASCGGAGRAKRPDSHGMKVCPDCGNVADRKRCNKCGASMKWPKAEPVEVDPAACPDCNGTGSSHYAGQIGSEPTPAEFVDALIAATREMVRVLKPSGSLWINLGDKYAGAGYGNNADLNAPEFRHRKKYVHITSVRPKSLLGIPWRYALRCIDDLGLILRAEVIWSKPNGLPESVTDRVRRSHEQWFHFTLEPRYYSAVDEVREEYSQSDVALSLRKWRANATEPTRKSPGNRSAALGVGDTTNPLGKLPGSVWTIPTQPLRVPDHLGVDHFAAFPMEWPRRIIRGWSPRDVCSACGEGRRPVLDAGERVGVKARGREGTQGLGTKGLRSAGGYLDPGADSWRRTDYTITGYACACTPYTDHPGVPLGGAKARTGNPLAVDPGNSPRSLGGPTSGAWREYHWDDWTPAPTTPGVVLDPFGGTGTTALVAVAEGRTAHHVDLSADYCRLAQWRITDPGERARAMQVEKPPVELAGQETLFEGIA